MHQRRGDETEPHTSRTGPRTCGEHLLEYAAGEGLETLVSQYRATMAVVQRLSRLYPEDVLRSMIDCPRLAMEQLEDEQAVATWSGVGITSNCSASHWGQKKGAATDLTAAFARKL